MKDVPSRVGLILTCKFEEKVLGEPGKGRVSRRAKRRKKEKRRDEVLREFGLRKRRRKEEMKD